MQILKGALNKIFSILKTAVYIILENSFLVTINKSFRMLNREGLAGMIRIFNDKWNYDLWLKKHTLGEEERETIRQDIKSFAYKPLVSVILPVYNIEEQFLRECIESVQNQYYPNWELCIADDASPADHIRRVLEEKVAEDERIKVVYREKNGHISAASNSALALAEGEFIALLDHDDRLPPEALYENVKLLNLHPGADMIYSDEDKINRAGERLMPFFKPDWSPDTFLSQMYTCHLGLYRTALVRQVGGFREGFEGSQDYDLVLRLVEKTDRIYHIPKVLYHWRVTQGSTAMNSGAKEYAYAAGLQALQEATARRGQPALVERIKDRSGSYRVKYLLTGKPKVSIIVVAESQPKFLEKCLLSLWEKSDYSNYEVIVINSGETVDRLKGLFIAKASGLEEKIKYLQVGDAVNYSCIYNQAADMAEGSLLLFLSDRAQVITPTWLAEMSAQALRPSIGAVGAKLLYPDGTIEHAGVTIGLKGAAGHGHRFFRRSSGGYFNRLAINANYAAVSGACLMTEKKLFYEAGGFDRQMDNGLFDVDYCLRLLEKGCYNLILADVQLYHDQPKNKEREDQGSSIFSERWAGYLYRDPFYNPNLSLYRSDYSISNEYVIFSEQGFTCCNVNCHE